MNKVLITNKTDVEFEYESMFVEIVDHLAEIKKLNLPSEVNLIIINPSEMAQLYKEYKNMPKETDVLSFPNDYEQLAPLIKYNMLGDIYINYEKIKEQAKEYGHSEKREWAYLFAHGLLHLVGHDHMESHEENEMNELANELMEKIKVGR